MKDYTRANNLIANSSQFAHAVDGGTRCKNKGKALSFHWEAVIIIIASLVRRDVPTERRGGRSASAILDFLATGHSLAPWF